MLYTKGHLATRNGTEKDRILPLGAGWAGARWARSGFAREAERKFEETWSRKVSDTERLRNQLTLAALAASPELVVPSGNVLAGRPVEWSAQA